MPRRTTMKHLSKTLTVGSMAIALASPMLASSAPAFADTRDGQCNSGEFCYYYNSNEAGAISDFTDSLDDYGTTQPSCYEFKGTANGHDQCIKNNAASVWNRSNRTVRVYFNSNFAGSYQDFVPGARGNLRSALYNNNASHQFLSAAPPTGCRTDGTNTTPPSTILVYRTKLGRVDRVGFKTYVKNVLPNEWVSSWPNASLDSGALAVKSYAWYWALHSTRKTGSGQCYDVRDDTADQVYRPWSAVSSTSAAVDRTWPTRMTRSGNILQAHYCSTTTSCSAWVDGNWMSQYGSRDLAARGYAAILHYYYWDMALT